MSAGADRSPSPAAHRPPALEEGSKRVMWWTLSVPSRAPTSARYLYRYAPTPPVIVLVESLRFWSRYRWGFLWAYVAKNDSAAAAAALRAEAVAARRTMNIDALERERRYLMSATALLCALLCAVLLAVADSPELPRALRAGLALPLAIGFSYGGSAGCGL
jgi:hypothetical protein